MWVIDAETPTIGKIVATYYHVSIVAFLQQPFDILVYYRGLRALGITGVFKMGVRFMIKEDSE